MAGAATALTPIVAYSPARAAAPPAGKQVPGWYRYKVGTIEVTAVTDGARTTPIPDNYISNANKDAINAALGALYFEKDKLTTPFTPIVVNTGSKLVVIDTGLGPNMFEQSKGAVGQFHTNLAAAGIDRNAVDTVIISHFHADHINGLLTADSKPAFPNAEIMVPATEWAYWSDDGDMSKAPAGGLVETVFKNERRVFGTLGNVLAGQGTRARYHLPGELWPYARPYLTRRFVRLGESPGASGCHRRRCRAVRAQSRLVPDVRHGRPHDGTDPPQDLRHGRQREDADPGLPPAVPRSHLH
jgi:glyoxylase-like metal-dependent hydrolase (beta-lactamase superfamily II)